MLQEIADLLRSKLGNLLVVFDTPYMEIPGIGAASAYASGDAFGTRFSFDVPASGIIETAIMLDLDDEGIQTDLWLFTDEFTQTADNAAFAVSDSDLMHLEAVIAITNFANAANNQVGINNGLGMPFKASKKRLWCQCVTRGAPTIAAGNLPRVALRGLKHEV